MKKIVIGMIAHVDSGKTTLSEAMLYLSGNLNKLGRVDHRDSFLDTNSLERSRGITIFSKQAIMNYKDTVFTIMDTPGHVDFSAETERTLQVLDYAVLVISGTDGIQSHTITLWKLLKKYRVPCFVFINKMDLPSSDRDMVLNQLKNEFSDSCIDFGCELTEIFESAALCDEKLFEKFDVSGSLDRKDIIGAIRERKIFPCIFGSALRLDGVEELIDCIYDYAEMPEYPSEFSARVFKISEDDQGNRLTFIKVTGGTLNVREVLSSDNNRDNEKVSQIRIYSGKKFTAEQSAIPGTVCALTGISFARPGDGLGEEKDVVIPVLEPVLSYSLILPDGTDPHKALDKMKILENEDPLLRVAWDEHSGTIQVSIMGEIQLEILKSVIKERFGMDVSFGKGRILYKETIRNTVEGVGHFEPLRHYAEVHLLMRPGKRDSGLVFSAECREDLLDRNWQRLILTHLHEKTHRGVLTGSPVTDMEIILVSGKAHLKHTEGGDFRQATYRAVRQGLRSAESVLLEPIYEFTLEIPSECIGRAISDIQRMSGEFEDPLQKGDMSVLKGTAPVSEMSDYAGEVIRYTRGRGRLVCDLKGYDICHNADEVIEQTGYSPDQDTDNPCDSVFCSHGAGHIVKWNEVKDHMHLSAYLTDRQLSSQPESKGIHSSDAGNRNNLFASDRELMDIFERTYGPVRKSRYTEKQSVDYSKDTSPKASAKKTARKPSGDEYLLVDGYNVIYSWPELKKAAESNIEAARNTLINILCNYSGYKKCRLILVFDAYKVKGGKGSVERVNNIDIVYTKEAETADMYIEKTSHKLSPENRVRVVTSDGLEQLIILGAGALRVSSPAFLEEVMAAEKEIREIIDSQ